ncbi:MAG TPA: NADPH-dependent FMN reductase, partial [Kofleriaceae bacterium]|nr:NADPH-dependent FMN reductase [Kofleriaceae bacterium]
MASMTLLGICGSLRKKSLNRALLRAVAETLPADAALVMFERLGEIPPFNSDVEGDPEPVAALKEALRAAEGVVIATPEYNYSVPGVLKNALDWASRPQPSPLRGKPVGIVGCSVGMSGSMRAQYHLRQILVYSDSPTLNQPEILIPRAQERFDQDGRMTDESTRDLMRKFGAAMVAHAQRHA